MALTQEALGTILANGMDREQLDAGMAILANLAKRASMSLDELLARSLETALWYPSLRADDGGMVNAAVAMGRSGKRILMMSRQGFDVTSLIHEAVHCVRPFLPQADQDALLAWSGEPEWNQAAEERVAWGTEQLMREGVTTGDPQIDGILAKLTAWVRAIYEGLFGDRKIVIEGRVVELDEQSRQVMGAMLAGVPPEVEVPVWADPATSDARQVWHGSGAQFDDFSTEFVGTGVGRQSRGWGVYFSDEKEAAQYYRGMAVRRPTVESVFEELGIQVPQIPNVEENWAWAIAAQAGEDVDDLTAARRASYASVQLRGIDQEALAKAIRRLREPVGALYQVEIPAEHDLLDWEATLADQGQGARGKLEQAQLPKVRAMLGGQRGQEFFDRPDLWTGEDLYNELVMTYGTPEAASMVLSDAGISGIVFDDEATRSISRGSRGYVIFDPNSIRVLDVMYQRQIRSTPLPEEMLEAFANQARELHARSQEVLSEASTDEELDAEFWETQSNYYAKRAELYDELVAGHRLFGGWWGVTYLVHTSTQESREERPIQISQFDDRGPIGHDLIGPNNLDEIWEILGQATIRPQRIEFVTPEEAILRDLRRQYAITPQWMRAPNGERTKLTERQWLQVRTPAFKAWFGGDWETGQGAKLLDSNGEPRVFYHGTARTGIEVFQGWRGAAGHFAQERSVAQHWAEDRFADAADNGTDIEFGDKATVYEVFLSPRNVFDLTDEEHLKLIGQEAGFVSDYSDLEEHSKQIKAAGFDAWWDYELGPEHESRPPSIAVVSPEHVKSATANSGAFELGNPNILFQRSHEAMAAVAEGTQSLEVRKQHEGKAGWLLAPNGEPTRLTEMQWLQVRTPSFKAWFGGDWEAGQGSKLLDPNGEPMVLWHGTANEFDVFMPRTSYRSYGWGSSYPVQSLGYFFSPSRELAWEFADNRADTPGQGRYGHVMACYLNPQNLLDLRRVTARAINLVREAGIDPVEHFGIKKGSDTVASLGWWQSQLAKVQAGEVVEGGRVTIDMASEVVGHLEREIEDRGYLKLPNLDINPRELWEILDLPEVVEAIKKAGYDGAIINETVAAGKIKDGRTTYVVFDPTSIKSATKNIGTFDRTNPSIYDRKRQVVEEEKSTPKALVDRYDQVHEGVPFQPVDATWWMYQRTDAQPSASIIGAKLNSYQGILDRNTARELYEVVKIYRSRDYETFRYLFVKDSGEIVDHIALTSHHPSRALAAPTGSGQDDYFRFVVNMAKDLDAKVCLIHNHPSGDPTPSTSDYFVSESFRLQAGDRYIGHIILDHGTFCLLDPKTQADHERTMVPTGYSVGNDPTIRQGRIMPFSGTEITQASLIDIARYAEMDLSETPDTVPIFLSDVKDRLTAMSYVPIGVYSDKSLFRDFIEKLHRSTGTLNAFPVVDGSLRLESRQLMQAHLIADAAIVESQQNLWVLSLVLGHHAGFSVLDGKALGGYTVGERTDTQQVHQDVVYHVTAQENLESIWEQGLVPGQQREIDAQSGIFVFTDRASIEDALGGWLGDKYEDVELAVITIWSRGLELHREAGYEAVTMGPIEPGRLLLAETEQEFFASSGPSPDAQVQILRRELEGSAQWMRAPNGEPTNLSERQFLQVRTQAFKDWFGEWQTGGGSKILDDNGEPMVCYHGTPSVFEAFDMSQVSANTGNEGHYGYGMYFSMYEGEAQGYAHGENGRLIPAFLNVQKVFDPVRDIEQFAAKWGFEKEPVAVDPTWLLEALGRVDPVCQRWAQLLMEHPHEKAWDTWLSEVGGGNGWPQTRLDPNDVMDWVEVTREGEVPALPEYIISGLRDNLGEEPKLVMGYSPWNRPNMVYATDHGNWARDRTQDIKAAGYDGVWAGSEVVVFESGQVKSATENRGTFSPETTNILYQRSRATMVDAVQPLELGTPESVRVIWRHRGHCTALLEAGGGAVELVSLRTPVRHRGAGDARALLAVLASEAESKGLVMYVNASALDRRTNQSRLEGLYESIGFERTAWKVNPAGDPVMVRIPEKMQATQGGYEEALLRVQANNRWMVAPNGEPTNLSEKQWIEVRSGAFKNYFGPWDTNPEAASKTLDGNGEPKVYWHGTPGEFEAFGPGYRELGFHFGTEGQATQAIDWKNQDWDAYLGPDDSIVEPRHLYGVYLNIRNPCDIVSDLGQWSDKEMLEEYFLSERGNQGPVPQKLVDKYAAMEPNIRFDEAWGNVYRNALAELGYDGILYQNSFEGSGNSVIAFEPNQIKSATDNSGAFDPSKDSILHQRSREGLATVAIQDTLMNQVARAQREGVGLSVIPEDMAFEKTNPGIGRSGLLRTHAEHLGDVVHRLSMGQADMAWGIEAALEKVGRQGLARDLAGVEDQLKREWEYASEQGSRSTMEEYRQGFEQALTRYADAYRAIPVYTQGQALARGMAVSLGQQHFGEVVKIASEIQRNLEGPGAVAWYQSPVGDPVRYLEETLARKHEINVVRAGMDIQSSDRGEWAKAESEQAGLCFVATTSVLSPSLVARGLDESMARKLGVQVLETSKGYFVLDERVVAPHQWKTTPGLVDAITQEVLKRRPTLNGQLVSPVECHDFVERVISKLNEDPERPLKSVLAAAETVGRAAGAMYQIRTLEEETTLER